MRGVRDNVLIAITQCICGTDNSLVKAGSVCLYRANVFIEIQFFILHGDNGFVKRLCVYDSFSYRMETVGLFFLKRDCPPSYDNCSFCMETVGLPYTVNLFTFFALTINKINLENFKLQ